MLFIVLKYIYRILQLIVNVFIKVKLNFCIILQLPMKNWNFRASPGFVVAPTLNFSRCLLPLPKVRYVFDFRSNVGPIKSIWAFFPTKLSVFNEALSSASVPASNLTMICLLNGDNVHVH